ncbi:hypothetical protein [Marinoscillum furvescens]|uniref:Lipoprotein n=1 Tax=Marinoscillum furvescens DSM 4134 TaxID=1122208 RepID=A0A3D9L8B6_MARFU|nr:hypothetical protein [Marinoscillum furvescens]REE01117.1 hypothetical protein C7460_104137 [Marinoscillum furvescens DSM 4134]
MKFLKLILFLCYIALLIALFSCKNSQKNTSTSKTEATLEQTTHSDIQTHQIASKTTEITTSSSGDTHETISFEIVGPVEISPDGTITGTDSTTRITGTKTTRKKHQEEKQEVSQESDSSKTSDQSKSKTNTTLKNKEKEQEVHRTVSWKPWIILGIVIIIILAGLYILYKIS